MKKSGAVLFLLLLTALFEPAEVRAAEPLAMELKPEGLYVDNVNVPVLQKMFADYGYKDYIYMPEWKYPPLFLNSLPEDFAKTEDKSFRNRLFIQILAPLALLVNERITLERYPLLLMREQLDKGEKLTAENKKELERLAEKYDVFTRMKGDGRYEILLAELLNRADEVPPSFLIAAAAAESNWGTRGKSDSAMRFTNGRYGIRKRESSRLKTPTTVTGSKPIRRCWQQWKTMR